MYTDNSDKPRSRTKILTLKKLRRAIQNRRRGILPKGVGQLFHVNARSYVARDTTDLLDNFDRNVISHPFFSPDLAPSDYHLFLSSGGKMYEDRQRIEKKSHLMSGKGAGGKFL